MAVGFHGGLYSLVTQTLCNKQWGEPHFNKKAGVAVTNIVHPYVLNA